MLQSIIMSCNSTFEHPAYLNSAKKQCGYINSDLGKLSLAPSEMTRLDINTGLFLPICMELDTSFNLYILTHILCLKPHCLLKSMN